MMQGILEHFNSETPNAEMDATAEEVNNSVGNTTNEIENEIQNSY